MPTAANAARRPGPVSGIRCPVGDSGRIGDSEASRPVPAAVARRFGLEFFALTPPTRLGMMDALAWGMELTNLLGRRLPALTLVAGMSTAACSPSSHYVPKDPTKAHLAMVGGTLSIRRSGVASPEGEMHRLAECDELARSYARSAVSLRKDAKDYDQAASVLYLVAGPLLLGAFLNVLAAGKRSESEAATIDSINRLNDAESCHEPSPSGAVAETH